MITHVPVLLHEVIEYFNPKPNQLFIDGTVGQGGHAEVILERILPRGRLLGIDRDSESLGVAKKRLLSSQDRVVFVEDSFANTKSHAYVHQFTHVNGILLDLGFASHHVDVASRGFTFKNNGPFDMRYDRSQKLSAQEIVNTWSEDELARIFRIYGEEKKAREIAKAIVRARKTKPLKSTTQLADLVEQVVKRRGKIHPATKVFQAIRIAVNTELDELEKALPDLIELLEPKGRIAIITFHSLEDRMVKRFFANSDQLTLVNKKVIKPSQKEIKANPRARSAKLRIAEKV